jgi:hypothetical protein
MSAVTRPPSTDAVARPGKGRAARSNGRCTRREGRHALELLAVSALGLVPWTIVLGLTLPSDYRVHAWSTAWVGFDVMLLAGMAATAVLGLLRRRAVIIPALATAVLLVCDAWFDVSLDLGTSGVWTSAVLAVFVELPMAAFLFRKAYTLLRLQWEPRESSTIVDRSADLADPHVAAVRTGAASDPDARTLPPQPAGASADVTAAPAVSHTTATAEHSPRTGHLVGR